jgi:hypothetical protein
LKLSFVRRRVSVFALVSAASAALLACGARVSEVLPNADAGTTRYPPPADDDSGTGISKVPPPQPGICNPGEAYACTCPASGAPGSSVCNLTGTAFGPCACGEPVDAGGPFVPDSGRDSGPDSGLPANVVVVHTAPGAPPFRICFGTSFGGSAPQVVPITALPDSPSSSPGFPSMGPYPSVGAGAPGIYPGTVGALPQITDLSNISLVPFIVLASSVAGDVNFDGGNGVNTADGGPEEDCIHLIGTHGLGVGPDPHVGSINGRLVAGVDFFQLPTVPAGSLLDQHTYLWTLDGCLPGAVPHATENMTCGPSYDGGVGIGLGLAQLDTTTDPGSAKIGVQFAHRSTAIENTPVEVTPGGAPVLLHAAASAGVYPLLNDVAPVAPVALAPLAKYSENGVTPVEPIAIDVATPTTSFGVWVTPLDGGAPNEEPWPGSLSGGVATPGDLLQLPLSEVQALSAWGKTTASAPPAFQLGTNYTFILVGDPAAEPLFRERDDGGAPLPNPAYDGRGVHFLAFPNVFTPTTF